MTGTYAGQFNMEGFLDYDLPVWIRVLGSRIIGIVPTAYVASHGAEALVVLDEWLNAIQIIQLPFALVPLIKLSCDRNILNEFAISRCEASLASLFGFGLCAGNYVLLLGAEEQPLALNITFIAICVVYSLLCILILCEKTQRLSMAEEISSNLFNTEASVAHAEEEVDKTIKADIDF
tara:strand:+ start:260 stop:793 length:534 start_codon:yes stop_codon:yes gene_type:complete